MRNIILFIALLDFLPDRAYSQDKQYSEKVQVNIGNFFVPGNSIDEKLFRPFLRNVGVSYQMNVSKNIRVGLQYNRWYNWHQLDNFIPTDGNGYYVDAGPITTWQNGDVRAQYDYNFWEVTGDYYKSHKSHEVFAGVGISITAGKNTVTEGVYRHPGYPDWLIYSRTEKKSYLGGLAQAGYNYFLSKKRINIGASLAIRYYPTLPVQYYTNVNLGYRFNLLRRK